MFDQVKVNQNSLINLLKAPERDNYDIMSKKSGNDFFAMVLEKTGYDEKKPRVETKSEQTTDIQKKDDKNEPIKTEQKNIQEDNSRVNSVRDREQTSPAEEKTNPKEKIGSEVKSEKNIELTEKNIKKISESSLKEVKNKKINSKDSEEELSILSQLQVEGNLKKLTDLLRAAFSGNKKAEDENSQKLFSNLKSGKDKDHAGSTLSFKKNDTDKNQKSLQDIFASVTKEIKESVSREIFKTPENRKAGSKGHELTDRELKDLASNIIDNIKKNKAKDIVKHETKNASTDEVRNDKKPVLAVEHLSVKKAEISDDSSFDKNSSKEKNNGKDSFGYNGGKIDFSSKSGIEKMGHNLKAADFKESLQEIIDKAKVTVRDSRNGAFTIRLNPQELGNVNVNLVMENGVITGKFLVDNEDVKTMLLSSLNDLKYQMEEAGISVGEFSVNVNDQREKYLKQKDDESLNRLAFLNSDREVTAAADQYVASSAMHTGHINMVI